MRASESDKGLREPLLSARQRESKIKAQESNEIWRARLGDTGAQGREREPQREPFRLLTLERAGERARKSPRASKSSLEREPGDPESG